MALSEEMDYTQIIPVDNYVPSVYVAPPVFQFVGSVLERIVMGGQASANNSILAFMSGQRASQVQYIQGMLGIGIFIVCFVCIWFLTLVVLKCSRDSRDRMGCAAGYAFHDRDTDTKVAYMYAQQQRRREHQEHASVMADVDDADSIRRDNNRNTNTSSSTTTTTKRNPKSTTTRYSLSAVPGVSKPSSAERRALSTQRMSSLSMLGNGSRRVSSSLSSLFGKEPPQQQQRSTQAPNPAEYYDDDADEEEDVPIWSVSAHPNASMNYTHYRNSDNPETHPQHSGAEEIELHMELDSIVRSLTEDSIEDHNSGQTKTKNQGRRHQDRPVETLRSLPPAASKRVWIGDESSTSSSHENTRMEPDHATTNMDKVWGSTACCSVVPRHVARRKILTRLVFGVFACVSLVCCALLMTHMYIPLEQAAHTSQTVVGETTIIVEELNTVLDIVNTTATTAIALMASTPLQYAVICPSFPVDEFALQFGFNPNDIIATMETEYTNYIPTVVNAITTAQSASTAMTQVLTDIHESVATTNDYLWILPVIICTTILIIFSQLALLLAVLYGESGKRGSIMETPKIENCYGYTIIPLQTVIVVLSWLLVILFCFGIIVTFDSCLPAITTTTNSITARENKMDVALDTTRDKIDGAYAELTGGRGTPDDTVLAVLDKYVTEAVGTTTSSSTATLMDDLLYERLSTYVTGCGASTSSTIQEPDPLEELIVIQALLRESLEYVATQVNFAKDVLGLDYIEEKCGRDNNQVQLFFTNLNLLNAQFEQVNMAITRSYNALNCPRLHTLYQEAVHQAFCTDVATANTNGLLLLIAISFSGMILITLRASWRSAT